MLRCCESSAVRLSLKILVSASDPWSGRSLVEHTAFPWQAAVHKFIFGFTRSEWFTFTNGQLLFGSTVRRAFRRRICVLGHSPKTIVGLMAPSASLAI